MTQRDVIILDIAPSESLNTKGASLSGQEAESTKVEHKDRRMAGYHKTIVLTDEAIPNSSITTYIRHRYTEMDLSYLVKIMPCIEIDADIIIPLELINTFSPGDLDYWVPDVHPMAFATFRESRPNRFELLPLLTEDQPDWSEGKPPSFPQSKCWATCIPVVTRSCLMSVIEINLTKSLSLDYLVFESIGTYPAFGIVSAVEEKEETKD